MAKGLVYYGGSFFAGIGLAVLFGILAGVVESDRLAYVMASVACAIAGAVGGIIYLIKKRQGHAVS